MYFIQIQEIRFCLQMYLDSDNINLSLNKRLIKTVSENTIVYINICLRKKF